MGKIVYFFDKLKEYLISIRLKNIDYYVSYQYENDVDSSGEYKNNRNAE
jgi:hypothetical protein